MDKNKILGVYISSKKISFVAVQAKHIVHQMSLPLLDLGDQAANVQVEGAIPQLVKQAEVIRSALSANKIEVKAAFVGLSSKDLFIRGFQMLPLSWSEIDAGVRFEAKKYLPSKTEDLVFDYQHNTSKKIGKMDVLFTATTQNTLEKYLGIFTQLGISTKAIEPASFSLIRIFPITKQADFKKSFAVVTMQEDDIEFSIVIDGFPCFSRDIKLTQPANVPAMKNIDVGLQEKIISEIRISLDYFRRQFSGRSVDNIIFIAKNIKQDFINELSKGLGINSQLLDLNTDRELSTIPDVDILKAYALALRNTVRINLTINLLRRKPPQPATGETKIILPEKPFVFNIKMLKTPLIIAVVLLVLAYIYPMSEMLQASNNLKKIKAEAQDVLGPNFSVLPSDIMQQKKSEYDSRLSYIRNLLSNRYYFTPLYNILPQAIKQGLWVDEISVLSKNQAKTYYIKGAVYLGDENIEIKTVNDFLDTLKNNPEFMKGLQSLELRFVSRSERSGFQLTIFEILGS